MDLLFCIQSARVVRRGQDAWPFRRLGPTGSGLLGANEGKSLLVIQDGRTIFEDYPNGYSASEPVKIYSGTKGFWNITALVAEQEGLLRLKEKAVDTLPEWRGTR